MRIVSLLPSATEIVCTLGAGGELVGISHECDHPPQVVGLPTLTCSRLSRHGSSGTIDQSVRDLLGAVSYGAVCAAVDQLAGRNVQVVSLPPRRLDDIWDNIRTVAAALGRAATGEALLAGLRARLDRVQRRTAGPPRPRVVSVEWLDPVMLGGTWMPELITTAGGDPLGVKAGTQAPTLDMAALKTLEPEVVVIKPCGYSVEHTLAELDLLPEVLPWDDWPAVRTGRVYVADGNAYFNRSGPRIVDSAELLAGCLHPDRFPRSSDPLPAGGTADRRRPRGPRLERLTQPGRCRMSTPEWPA